MTFVLSLFKKPDPVDGKVWAIFRWAE